MTQPIQEPSPTRTDAALGWSSRQLMRRPNPVFEVRPPVFRAAQWNEEFTSATGTDMDSLIFDMYSNPDTSIFDVQVDGSGNLTQVDILVPGFLIVNFQLFWEGNWDASVAGGIWDLENVWPLMGQENTRFMRQGNIDGFVHSVSIARHYPTIFWDGGVGGGNELPQFSFFAGQSSGSSRQCQGRFDIAYFTALTGSTVET